MDLLPDDMLANVLGRLPPCTLAASRCVSMHWCAVVDTRRLLRADLLPLRLDAFYGLADLLDIDTYFFARPSTARRIASLRDYIPDDPIPQVWIEDHCNGLLLLWERVANPATRQWADLPPFPDPASISGDHFRACCYLAYDPFLSPHHFQVFSFPMPLESTSNIKFHDSEWPPSLYTAHVFSSTTWRWEERSFVRHGEAAGTFADMCYTWEKRHRHAVYLRGSLYVHCQNDSVMRITLSNDKYQMIKSPPGSQIVNDHYGSVELGKSEKGVYSILLWQEEDRWPKCQVWLLNESCGQMEWVLKSDISLQAVVENFPDKYDTYSGPWIVNNEINRKSVNEAYAGDEFEWDFDNGIVLHETKDEVGPWRHDVLFLGFHPYKEIAFFLVSRSRAVSYHLNSLKVQELGILHGRSTVVNSFPYTPCRMGNLFENN